MVSFQGVQENGQRRLEVARAGPIEEFGETNEQGVQNRGVCRFAPVPLLLGRGDAPAQEGNGVFAVKAGRGDELIQNARFLGFASLQIARSECLEQLM